MGSKAYFDEVAPDWDSMRSELYSVAVREIALGRAGLQPGQVVADIGPGSGFMSEGLLAQGLNVIAVDESPAMLAELERRFPSAERLSCRPGESERLPLAEGEADRVFANMVLHHVERPAATIAEMARILRPGGRLLITDLDAHEHAFLAAEHHDRWLGFQREHVRDWFGAAGLSEISVEGIGED